LLSAICSGFCSVFCFFILIFAKNNSIFCNLQVLLQTILKKPN
jgi:hypothetical protein